VTDHIRHIAVEGPIGVGKTSLARALADRLGGRLVLEPAEYNPFLEKFYADMPRYALATQLSFLVARYQQQAELRQQDLFEPVTVCDYLFVKDKIFAALTLSDDELNLYNQLYAVLAGRAARPDLVVLLDAGVETLLARIERRGIPSESAVTADYLARLTAAYRRHFRLYAEAPLLVIDTEGLDYDRGGLDLDELLGEMELTRAGRRLYTPGSQERD